MKFILGAKLRMSQIFDEKGNVVPITLVEAGPCYVTQIKIKEARKDSGSQEKKDGYEAVQIGFGGLKEKKIKKSQKNKPYKCLKEFRGNIDIAKYKAGDKIDVSIFQEGEEVAISGISKGKGFQGAVKLWGFKGKMATHGTKHEGRTVGSVGSRYPQRVIKGKKMPGRMGSERITVKNLKVVKIDKENNLLAIRGAVPGRKGTILEIRGK